MFGLIKKPLTTDEETIRRAFNRRKGDLGRRLENEGVFPNIDEAVKILGSRRCRIYLGIDPTGPDIHLGHTIPLLFLKQLQKLGHTPVLVIGDFTARIGDPTGKEISRKPLTEKEVKDNMKNYLVQVYKILPKDSFEVKYNSSWLSKMSFQDVVELASHVTVQQMLQREMFQKHLWKWRCSNCKKISRSLIQFGTQEAYDSAALENNSIECPHCKQVVPYEKKDIFLETELRLIGLQEFLYPLMQGYDSVAMDIDGEVGGNDQTFNMLVGRDLEKKLLNKDKLVFATQLLVDSTTGKKMSKSEGGLISLSDAPGDMFGKIMSVPDGFIRGMFKLCTERDMDWIEKYDNDMKTNPYEFKKELAFELVIMYHGENEAVKARDEWESVFSKGELPSEMEEVKGGRLVDVVGSGAGVSSTQSKKLIDQGAVRVNSEVVKEWGMEVKKGDVIQIGPKKFLKIAKN
jgi:tyrosyl-tRNA synthetase